MDDARIAEIKARLETAVRDAAEDELAPRQMVADIRALLDRVGEMERKLAEAEQERDDLIGSVRNLDAEVLSALEGLGVNLDENAKGPSLITSLAVAVSAFLGVNKDLMADLTAANARVAKLEEALADMLKSMLMHEGEDILGRVKGTWGSKEERKARAARAAAKEDGDAR